MEKDNGRITIRQASAKDARQIAEIIVEDWKAAYRGVIEDAYLDSLSVEERCAREVGRYAQYTVAAEGEKVLGLAWNELTDGEDTDCEIVALYVRYADRNRGIGKALFRNAADDFRAAGRKRMIVWCLRDNLEARKFYEAMGGKEHRAGSHIWGAREYPMVSYLYRLDG